MSTRDLANTILKQLQNTGMNNFMCWGSHNFIALPEEKTDTKYFPGGLMFTVQGLLYKGRIQIMLAGNDTYTIRFGTLYKRKFNVKEEYVGIYFDQMNELIDHIVETESGDYSQYKSIPMIGSFKDSDMDKSGQYKESN